MGFIDTMQQGLQQLNDQINQTINSVNAKAEQAKSAMDTKLHETEKRAQEKLSTLDQTINQRHAKQDQRITDMDNQLKAMIQAAKAEMAQKFDTQINSINTQLQAMAGNVNKLSQALAGAAQIWAKIKG